MREEMTFDTFFPFIEHFIKFCIDLTLWDAKMRLEIDVKYKQKIDPNFSLTGHFFLNQTSSCYEKFLF